MGQDTFDGDAAERYSDALREIERLLGEAGREALLQLDDAHGQLLWQAEQRSALDKLVIGFRPAGCGTDSIVWRETRETEFDPILENRAERLLNVELAGKLDEGLVEDYWRSARDEAVRYAHGQGWGDLLD